MFVTAHSHILSSSGRRSHDPGIQLLLFWIPDQVGNDSEQLPMFLWTMTTFYDINKCSADRFNLQEGGGNHARSCNFEAVSHGGQSAS